MVIRVDNEDKSENFPWKIACNPNSYTTQDFPSTEITENQIKDLNFSPWRTGGKFKYTQFVSFNETTILLWSRLQLPLRWKLLQTKEWQTHDNNVKQHIKNKGKADEKTMSNIRCARHYLWERETNQSLQCHAETCVPSNDICLQLSRMHILYMLTPIERSDMVHGE